MYTILNLLKQCRLRYYERGLHKAASDGDIETIKKINALIPGLIKKQNSSGFTAMHTAAMFGQTKAVDLLHELDNGNGLIRMEIPKLGANPMLLAVIAGKTQVIRALYDLDPGSIRKKNRRGQTLMHFAVYQRNKEVIKLLHQLDPRLIQIADNNGLTPMHVVAIEGGPDIIKILHNLDPGLIRRKNSDGCVAMFFAAAYGHADVIRVLYDLDPEIIKIQDNDGKTVITRILEWKYEKAIKVFEQLGVLLPLMEILNWVRQRHDYANADKKLLRHDDVCPISGDKIFDMAELRASNGSFHKFERHYLVQWLLLKPKNPLTNQEISTEEIRQIFADRGKGIKSENSPQKVLEEESKSRFVSEAKGLIKPVLKYALLLIGAVGTAIGAYYYKN